MATTSGMSGGSIDVNSLVSQLMQIESRPLTRLKQKESSYQTKISAYGTLLSSVSSLKSAVAALKSSSIGMSASVSDSSYLSASASSTAIAGTYNLNIKQLAKAQNLYSGTFSATTDPVADLSSVAIQKLKVQVGTGTAKEITVDSTNNTLAGIKDAINSANAGVTATIVQDGSNYRLTLIANTTGASNTIKVQVDENNDGTYEEVPGDTDGTGLSKLAYNASTGVTNLSVAQAAQDAVIKVNGLELSRSSNTISDVISGVTLNLSNYDPNYATTPKNLTVTVGQDSSQLSSNLSAFVAAYNGTMSAIKQLRGNVNSPGVLQGDATLLSMKNALSSVTTMKLSSSPVDNNLIALGITHDKTGVMSLDSSKLSAAIAKDPTSVVSMVNTMASSLYTTVNTFVTSTIPSGKEGYEKLVKSIQKDEENWTRRLELTQQALLKKFTALDSVLTQLQNTSGYLTQQMEALKKSTK